MSEPEHWSYDVPRLVVRTSKINSEAIPRYRELDRSRRRVQDAVYQSTCGSNFYTLPLAELWLRLESCQLVGQPATSFKQQATGFKGESNIIIPEVT